VEFNRQKQARAVAGLLGDGVSKPLTAIFDNPARYLARQARSGSRREDELTALALARLAAGDPAVAAKQLEEHWSQRLDAENAAWAWAITARQAAFALMPEALDWTEKAWARLKKRDAKDPDWTDDTLAWQARAWLRLGSGEALARRAALHRRHGVDERNSAVWQYWRGRALLALAKPGEAGQAQRQEGQALLQALAPQLGYYGQLASEDLGVQALPPRPPP
jgi:soluble lytic murein transglycosylase